MSLSIGDTAPDFSLFSTDKQEVSLSSLTGRPVLILFFPMAFTSVCTTELCSVRDDIAKYNQLNVQILAISVDSVFTLIRYKEEQHLNFPLLSDFNKEVSLAYDTMYETFAFGMKGVGKRSAFVVDKEGKIAYAEVLENAGNVPDFDAIGKALENLS